MTTSTTIPGTGTPAANRWINLPLLQQGIEGGLPTDLVAALTNMMAGISLTPAQVAAAQGAQETSMSSWLSGNTQETVEDESEPDRFGTANPDTTREHSDITLMLQQMLGLPTGPASDIVNQWAQQWFDSTATGVDSAGNPIGGTWPTLADALADQGLYISGVETAKIINGSYLLPQFYMVREADNSITYWNNMDPAGPVPVDIPAGSLGQLAAVTSLWTTFDRAQIDAIMNVASSGRYDGGGGGTITFDREEIIAGINSAWQQLLMDLPGNPGALADRYIAQATSFYAGGTGGQLDFETWVRNQIRDTSRYAALYRRKPEGMAEEDFLGAYQGTARQFGLRPDTEQGQVEMGASTGVGQGDFARQIAGSREYQVGNLGAVSRQFASMFSQLGPIARS